METVKFTKTLDVNDRMEGSLGTNSVSRIKLL